MQFPKLNINGSHGPTLLNEYLEAASTVSSAIRALQRIDVHGRDYQTLDAQAYSRAHLEHVARLSKLESVMNELNLIADNLSEQIICAQRRSQS
jgi:hypothetical protein